MNNDIQLIDTQSALSRLCDQLSDTQWLAIDTEFERERTYYPELCLLQIATRDIVAVIDPLAIGDIEQVLDLLYNKSITKVFHSARQDLEIFFHLKGHVPSPLFDTQIAAKLFGHGESIGYAQLVELMLEVKLEKAHTRTNWKVRPLKPEHLRYAADDVIFLGQLYERFTERLTAPELVAKLEDELSKLENPLLYMPAPETMWKKLPDTRRFSGDKLSILKQLVAWREVTARKQNLPRKWVISDKAVINLARELPATEEELAAIKEIDDRLLTRHGQALLNIINGEAEIL